MIAHDAKAQIENLVRSRNTVLARRKILEFYKAKKKSPSETRTLVLIECCDWLRRLGLYKEGLQLLELDEALLRSPDAQKANGKRLLWAARFLNLIGATSFAIQLIEGITAQSAEDHRVLANIFLANNEYKKALTHFKEMLKLTGSRSEYLDRIARISMADAYSGLEDYDRAIQIAESVLERSEEPYIRGIALQAKGEYLARSDRFDSALEALLKAKTYFPASDKTPDMGVLCKWLAYTYAKKGNLAQSQKHFAQAFESLKAPGIRAEAWLDLYLLKEKLGIGSKLDSIRLALYPGIAPEYKKKLPTCKHAQFGTRKNPLIEIYPFQDEFVFSEKRYSGIPKEVQLLALVRMTAEWGINLEKIKVCLWPDEVFSFQQMDQRIHQLLRRLRNSYKIQIQLKDGCLDLKASMQNKIYVEWDATDPRPLFLREHSEFEGGAVSQHYNVSRTQRTLLLKNWQVQGWIHKSGSPPRVKYHRSK